MFHQGPQVGGDLPSREQTPEPHLDHQPLHLRKRFKLRQPINKQRNERGERERRTRLFFYQNKRQPLNRPASLSQGPLAKERGPSLKEKAAPPIGGKVRKETGC
ncbi:hypothetical protein CDAR_114671 [Caerostris darwini]|uniref:Uncharacterized protein n=1 Tax=Caerostris darwini TaxID=1538125 RepID=A0AAV4MF67_9ARAC|nr:hypothetical protein CDAR_114671 [Caerostris darwini]